MEVVMTPGVVARKRFILFASIILSLVSYSELAASPRSGIDCGCSKTDLYKKPAGAKKPVLKCALPDDCWSTKSTYQVEASQISDFDHQTNTVYLTVKLADGTQILNKSFTHDSGSRAYWGFSPDEHRFVYHWERADIHHIRLHNLTGAEPDTPVRSIDTTTGSANFDLSAPEKLLPILSRKRDQFLKAVGQEEV